MVYIIVEGSTDKELVKNLLAPRLENSDFSFLGLKGIDSVKRTIENLEELGLSQNSYFAIVDADESFENRDSEMRALQNIEQVPYYIFPNHQDSGDLETLILSCIEENNQIITCFDSYETCVGQNIGNKAKLYAYTTLEHNKRPEQYIQELTLGHEFDELRERLINLFEGI